MSQLFILWPFYRKYMKALIVMAASGIGMSLCQAAVAPLIGYLFDRVFSQEIAGKMQKLDFIDGLFASTVGNSPQILVWAIPVFSVLLYILNGVFRYTHLFSMRYTGDRVSTDLRQALLDKYLNLNLTFHNNYAAGSGGLLSRTMTDIHVIQSSTGMLADFIREPVLALVLIGYMVYVDWKFTLAVFVIAPILVLILRSIAKSLRKYGHRHQQVMESMTSILKEALDGIRIIQSYNLKNLLIGKFDRSAVKYLQTRKKIIAREEASGPISEVIGACIFASMTFYFGIKVLNGTSSPGVFMSFVTAMGFMQKPIKKVQDSFVRLQQTVVSSERVDGILKDESIVETKEDAQPFPEAWQKISFRGLDFSYKDEKIIDDIGFEVERGQVVALVGESGSGKSTLINLLERFFEPNKGSIYIDGTDIKDIELESLRNNIALVTQDVFLFNDSIENNIRFGDLKANGDFVAAAEAANASGFISKLPDQYKNSVGERGNLLSGGEKQRVSIARAVYKDAPILILDEATSALDSVSEVEVQKGLEKLMRGRTVFVIAHRLSTIKNADRIFVLKKGRIVESGTHDELLNRKGDYHGFHQIQVSQNDTSMS